MIDGLWEHFAAYLERFFTESLTEYNFKTPDVPGDDTAALMYIALVYVRVANEKPDRKTSSMLESLEVSLDCFESFNRIFKYFLEPTEQQNLQHMQQLLTEAESKLQSKRLEDFMSHSSCSEVYIALNKQANRLRQQLGRPEVSPLSPTSKVLLFSFDHIFICYLKVAEEALLMKTSKAKKREFSDASRDKTQPASK